MMILSNLGTIPEKIKFITFSNRPFSSTVPPNIVDEGTSGDLVSREGQDVSLSCRAEGRPLPRILWRREDGANIQLRNEAGELRKGKLYFISIVESLIFFALIFSEIKTLLQGILNSTPKRL